MMQPENIQRLTEMYNQLEKSKKRLSDIHAHLWETKQYYMLRKLITSEVIQLETQKNILLQITATEPISATELAFLKDKTNN